MRYTNLSSMSRKVINKMESGFKRTKLVTKPIMLTIEPTLKCNSNCIMCNRNFSRVETKAAEGFLSWETFNKIKPFFKYADSVLFEGFGEPLLHPDYLIMLREIKKSVPFVYFYSNGILITEKIGKELVDSGIDMISISIGGATRDTYKKIRGIDAFDTVVENLCMVNEYKIKMNRKKPILSFNVVAMNSLLDELEALVHLADEIGVSSISMPNLVVQGSEIAEESIWLNIDKAKKSFHDASVLAKRLNIKFSPPRLDIYKGDCKAFFRQMVINWDGTVMTCPMERYIIGDLKRDKMEDIWNSKGMIKLRKDYFEKGLEATCPKCICWDNNPETYLHPWVNSREYATKL